ncbi:GNAT family N-acetyltransferase [Ascidiimonas sp. W6]|uniref:GNAT family N-acetyltransferase n=1 Tax=Ascidiimonas meishanensis TaxID=3128903 RepID=UPI0030EDD0E7
MNPTPFVPQKVILKNHKTVLLRQAVLEDAKELSRMIKTYLEDSPYIPKNPKEFKLTLEKEEAWIDSFITKENSLLLVAVYEGQLVGNIDLTGHHREVMQHTAMVGMGMLKAWREVGLGSALLHAAIIWAQQNPILEKLWLQVYTDNKAGVALYKKFRFEENGILTNFFKQDNRYYDNLTMSLNLLAK